MKEQFAMQQRETGRPVKLVSAQALLDRTNEMRDIITRHGYEEFESRGYVHDQDVDDWLQAESELLHLRKPSQEDCDGRDPHA